MFTKRETNICKGIAIILMLFHHLFNDFEEYAGYPVNYWPFTGERILFFASLAKICVAIFVFLSGYGLAASFRKKFDDRQPNAKELKAFIWARYSKLMSGYWFIFILTLLCQPLGRTIFDAYGHSGKEILLYFVIDFFGLSYLFTTPTLNPTWWYISLAVCIILLVPFFLCLMRRYGSLIVLLARTAGVNLTGLLNPSTFYLFSLLLGITCFETQFFDKLQKMTAHSARRTAAACLTEGLLFLVLLSYRTNYNFTGIVDGLLAMVLACLVHTFLTKIPVIADILQQLGKHSANMFMAHTPLYFFYFPGFFYSFKHWAVILLVLTTVTFVLSVLIEFVKKKLRYPDFVKKLEGAVHE